MDLSRDPATLPLDLLPRKLRRLIARRLGRVTTIAELLRYLNPDEQGQLLALLDVVGLERRPPPPPPPPLSLVPNTLHGESVSDLLSQTSGDALRQAGQPGWYSRGYLTVRDALTFGELSPNQEAALRSWLDDEAMRRSLARAEMQQAETWRGRAPLPCFEPAWALLRKRQEALVRTSPPIAPRTVHFSVDLDEPSILTRGAILRLDPPSIELRVFNRRQELGEILDLLDLLCQDEVEGLEGLIDELGKPPWARTLDRLDRVLTRGEPAPEDLERIVGWRVHTDPELRIELISARPRKAGGWVTRKEDPGTIHAALLTPEDHRIATTLMWSDDDLGDVQVLRMLLGHPKVFLPKGNHPVAVREGRLELGVRRQGRDVHLLLELDGRARPGRLLSGQLFANETVMVDTMDGHVRVTDVLPGMVAVIHQLAQQAIVVPPDGLGALRARLPKLTRELAVSIDAELLGHPQVGDQRPVITAGFDGASLQLEVRVAPLPETSPQLPGQGSTVLFGRRGDHAIHVRRDLALEPGRVRERLEDLQLPADAELQAFRWQLDDPQVALGVVERLNETREQWQLRWTGPPPELGGRAQASQLRLGMRSQGDWFRLRGELEVDGGSVGLEALMEAAAAGHRFVNVGKGRWVALEERLRVALATAGAVAGAEGISALHAPVLDTLEALGAALDAPRRWREAGERSREARTLQVALPAGLQGTLRDYQQSGFEWLGRLAHWAPGACLADDMGLGKTVQALALLLRRRGDGPALVVAPTSVVDVWLGEIERFAPGLTVRAHRGSRRTLEDLPEVLVTSYGILQRDVEALAALAWGTVILDEAQAIKNPDTARAKAACAIGAGFRLALSGTPVENRPDELWSLFRFVAPGLLAGRTAFSSRFGVPIAEGNRERRSMLASLVAPFVLRRTKAQVALELPPRTEQTLRVTLGPDERALYEQARLLALARIESEGAAPGFSVLQELLQLRKLACHPRLADPGSSVPSSKLRAVLRVLEDLRDSGQRALVFSSFTSHLGLLREALDDRGFRYRYLDGSTPAARRKDEVAAFQSGDGEAFLISLKAGGSGLTLTAATYVLHLDPWWNPAAEDQASDRAHRIGQDQPVTIYRFVAADTIEEEIVRLHQTKRELAEALLADTGSTRQVTASELLGLLHMARSDEAPRGEVVEFPRSRSVAPAPALPSPVAEASREDMLQRYRDHVQGLVQQGVLARPATARSYVRAVKNFLQWAPDLDDLSARAEEYVALSRDGLGLGKSDRVYAGPGLRRLLELEQS